MAGSEFTGLKAARANLFEGTTCIVTPGDSADATAQVSAFWQSLGCRIVQLAAAEHDECVALVSHLPHIVAGTLVRTVAANNPHALNVVGPGFRDTTRVASGPAPMWTEILRENSGAVVAALDAMIAKLAEFRQTLAAQSSAQALHDLLAAAKETRDQITFPK